MTSNKTCFLFNDVPLHVWHLGITSGQKVTWTAHDSMLTLNKIGNYPQSGNTTIVTDKEASSSFMVDNSFAEIWEKFNKYGYLVSSSKSFGNGLYGAASANVTWSLGKRQHSQWCLAGFIPIETSQVCDPCDCQESVLGCLGNRQRGGGGGGAISDPVALFLKFLHPT